jgi:hypothetical protein
MRFTNVYNGGVWALFQTIFAVLRMFRFLAHKKTRQQQAKAR